MMGKTGNGLLGKKQKHIHNAQPPAPTREDPSTSDRREERTASDGQREAVPPQRQPHNRDSSRIVHDCCERLILDEALLMRTFGLSNAEDSLLASGEV
jgi:hypothetical protein